MKKKIILFLSSWQFSVTLTSLIFGCLLSLQLKSQATQRAALPSRRIEEMSQLYKESEEKRVGLEKSLTDLRTEVSSLKKQLAGRNNNSEIKQNYSEYKTNLMITGLISTTGPGVIIHLDDSKKPTNSGTTGFILDEDLLKVTNILRASGAEAISINGNRLISTSEISAAGATILVNKTRVIAPFEINAIGNPDILDTGLEMRGGVMESLKFLGMEINVEKSQDVTVPAYQGDISLKYSHPTPNSGK